MNSRLSGSVTSTISTDPSGRLGTNGLRSRTHASMRSISLYSCLRRSVASSSAFCASTSSRLLRNSTLDLHSLSARPACEISSCCTHSSHSKLATCARAMSASERGDSVLKVICDERSDDAAEDVAVDEIAASVVVGVPRESVGVGVAAPPLLLLFAVRSRCLRR